MQSAVGGVVGTFSIFWIFFFSLSRWNKNKGDEALWNVLSTFLTSSFDLLEDIIFEIIKKIVIK